MFKRGFKEHGTIPLSTYMKTYRYAGIHRAMSIWLVQVLTVIQGR